MIKCYNVTSECFFTNVLFISNFSDDITDNNAEYTEENTDASDCVEPFISEVHTESHVKEEREEIEMRMEEESLSQGKMVLCRYECIIIYIRLDLCIWIMVYFSYYCM